MLLTHSQRGHSYQLLRQISNDGTGTLYLAQDLELSRQVAVKVIFLNQGAQQSDSMEQRMETLFDREIQKLIQLAAPSILPLLDAGWENREEARSACAYVVMEYSLAGSLEKWVTRTRERKGRAQLGLVEVSKLVMQVASALQYAHERGILHQDIKPSNILLRSDPTLEEPILQVADFHLVPWFAKTSLQSLSQSAYVRNSSLFLAPEQWDGHPVAASDQYSLAILAFELLTGQYPFHGSLSQLIHQHHMTAPPPPSSCNPQLNASVDTLFARALAKEPEQRYPSVLAFAQALTDLTPLLDAHPIDSHMVLDETPQLLSEGLVTSTREAPLKYVVEEDKGRTGMIPASQDLEETTHVTADQPESAERSITQAENDQEAVDRPERLLGQAAPKSRSIHNAQTAVTTVVIGKSKREAPAQSERVNKPGRGPSLLQKSLLLAGAVIIACALLFFGARIDLRRGQTSAVQAEQHPGGLSSPHANATPGSPSASIHSGGVSPNPSPKPAATRPRASSSPQTPTPASGANVTFEDGGLDGWSSAGSVLRLTNSTAYAHDGTHSLKMVLYMSSPYELPYVYVPFSSGGPVAGEMLKMDLYVPSGSAYVAAHLYVQKSTSQWYYPPVSALAQGQWVELALKIPSMNGSAMSLGAQFYISPTNTNATIYLDSVSW